MFSTNCVNNIRALMLTAHAWIMMETICTVILCTIQFVSIGARHDKRNI